MIYVLVEGSDDVRFVDRVLRPILEPKFGLVKTWEYAKKKDEAINGFIKSIQSMQEECLFLVDADNKSQAQIISTYTSKFNNLCSSKVNVVLREIEAWYLSGINEKTTTLKLAKSIPKDTSSITKEMFDTYFMRTTGMEAKVESLNTYDVTLACQRSPSFKQLYNKY